MTDLQVMLKLWERLDRRIGSPDFDLMLFYNEHGFGLKMIELIKAASSKQNEI